MTQPQPFATAQDIQDRLDETLTSAQLQMVNATLIDLSEEARYYGMAWPEPNLAPAMVKTLVMRACRRWMMNPEGYVQSRAGDETIVFTDRRDDAGVATFTAAEKLTLQDLAGKAQAFFGGAPVSAWDTNPRLYHRGRRISTIFVPVDDGTKPFPFCEEDDPFIYHRGEGGEPFPSTTPDGDAYS